MQRSELIQRLREIVKSENVLVDAAELMVYECDGFPIAKATPAAVVFPASTEQVAACCRLLTEADVPIIPRGSGTGLAGGAVPYEDGVILCTSRMKRIVDVDLSNRTATVEAGVLNTTLTDHVNAMPGGEKLHFAPDPSSQKASTIAGNAATNAGGIHTLKHGVTVNHILGLQLVLPDGAVLDTGGKRFDTAGPDLVGLVCGSEGTLGIITQVTVKLTPRPEAFRTVVGIFSSSRAACQSVADVIAAGLVPAAMEVMDGAMVKVVEEAFHYGFPPDAQALLLIELDGIEEALDEQMEQVMAICRKNRADDVECSANPERRAELWSARKRTFGAIGRISPSFCTQDACVPRSALPDVIDRVMAIGEKYGLLITNVFHAGDGNIHPILLFDEHDPRQVRDVLAASHEILEYCIDIGGALTGEHGVGVEKLPLMAHMFDEPTMQLFHGIKDLFDPEERINAGKLIPSRRLEVNLTAPPAEANVTGR